MPVTRAPELASREVYKPGPQPKSHTALPGPRSKRSIIHVDDRSTKCVLLDDTSMLPSKCSLSICRERWSSAHRASAVYSSKTPGFALIFSSSSNMERHLSSKLVAALANTVASSLNSENIIIATARRKKARMHKCQRLTQISTFDLREHRDTIWQLRSQITDCRALMYSASIRRA